MLEAPQSARLHLRPVLTADADEFFVFLGDPVTMRYTHCHSSVRECRRRLAGFEWMRRLHGYAPWAVIDQSRGCLIGWGGVYIDPFDPGWGPELGYAFHPDVAGRGLATELARICLEWADARLGLPETHAFVHPENVASRRVLEKTGYRPVRTIPEMQRILFHRRQAQSGGMVG